MTNNEQALVAKDKFTNTNRDIVRTAIRLELNFAKLPLFSMDDKTVRFRDYHAFVMSIKNENEERKIRLTVSPPVQYGLGGTFDHAAFRAIEYILSEIYSQQGRLENPLALGSGYRILKLMGLKDDGKAYERLNTFFRRMRGTTIAIENSVYDKQSKRWVESLDGEFIYKKVVLRGESLPDGNKADQIYLWLSDLYLNNLNTSFVCLVNYDFYKNIESSVTRRLFEILVSSYRSNNTIKMSYSELCLRIPLARSEQLWKAKEKLRPHLNALIDSQFLKSWEFKPTCDKNEWDIIFVFTEEALKNFSNGYEDLQLDIEVNYEIMEDPEKKKMTPADKQKEREAINIRDTLEFYKELLYNEHKIDVFIEYGRDKKILKELIAAYGCEKVQTLLKRYVRLSDPYIKSKSYPLVLFRKNFNALMLEEEEIKEYSQLAKYILGYLSERTGNDVKYNIEEVVKMISPWAKKGKVKEDFIRVIDNMTHAWGNDRKMREFLRPSTLFGPKFEEYANLNNGRQSRNYKKYDELEIVVDLGANE